MTKWEEKMRKVAIENNVILYKTMKSWEHHGDISVFIEAIEHLQEQS
jgi:hypothetical protein